MPASYLKIGGEWIQDAVLESVEIEQKLNRHWWCRAECRQTRDRRFAAEDALGKDMQILAVDQQGAQHVIFAGFVLESELQYEVFGSYSLRITAVTHSYKLDLTPREAYFRKKTLPDVAQALAAEDGLTAMVDVPPKSPKNYVQWGETDFSFLLRLADDHQAWIRPAAGGIQIANRFQPGCRVDWRTENGLLGFEVTGRMGSPCFSGTHYDARGMRSTDYKQVARAPRFSGAAGRMVDAVQRASASLPPGYMHLDPRAATADEYRDLLERESVRSIGSGVFALGRSLQEAIQAGDTIEIGGPVDAQGKYGVVEVTHHWTRTGYWNEFRCTPWETFVSPERPDPHAMRGLVTARVVDQNDPRKMGRVKVQYDWLEKGETGWIRMTTPHAGADRGFMFMPEKGDEVLVAFEHGDPERPYVLGCLWNGVDQAPREEFWGGDVEPNEVKRIVTKSGHRIQLSDKEGKEAIVIATPSKLKIALLEKADETGRSMILLHCEDGDIFVSAPEGRVHFRSKWFSREVGESGSARPDQESRRTAATAAGAGGRSGGPGTAPGSGTAAAGERPAPVRSPQSTAKGSTAPVRGPQPGTAASPIRRGSSTATAGKSFGTAAAPPPVKSATAPPGRTGDAAKAKPAKVVCKHDGLAITCSHEREAGILKTGVFGLEVLGKDGITATTKQLGAPCGKHPHFIAVDPVPAGGKAGVDTYAYNAQPAPVSPDSDFWYVLWPAIPRTTTATIAAASCSGGSTQPALISVYPDIQWEIGLSFGFGAAAEFGKAKDDHGKVLANQIDETDTASATLEAHAAVTVEGVSRTMSAELKSSLETVTRLASNFDALTRGVSKILKNVGGVEIGIDLPNVGFTGSWGWEEIHSDCRCGYFYDIRFSADPLVGVSGTVNVEEFLLKACPPVYALNEFLKDHDAGGLQIPLTVGGALTGIVGGHKDATEDTWNLEGRISGELTFTLEGRVSLEPHLKIHIFYLSFGGGVEAGASATATSGLTASISGGIESAQGMYVEGAIGFNGIKLKTAAWAGAGIEVRLGDDDDSMEGGGQISTQIEKQYELAPAKDDWLDSGKYYFTKP